MVTGKSPDAMAGEMEAAQPPLGLAEEAGTEALGLARYPSAWRRLLRKRLAAASLAIIVLLVFAAVFAGWLAPHDPLSIDYNRIDGFPDPAHGYLLGNDSTGRDLLARILYGLRVSLTVALVVETCNVLLGTSLGVVAGFFGGLVDGIISRGADIFFAFPGILLAVLVNALFGESFNTPPPPFDRLLPPGSGRLILIAVSISLVSWPYMSRFVRSQVLSLREREFVEGARAAGAGQWWIVWRHIMPNISNLILVWITLDIASVVISESTLSLLGLGIQPPYPSIGGMINDASAQGTIQTNPNEVLWPSLTLAALVLAFTFLGEGLRDVLDPRSRAGPAGH
jgi:peptide/nickel transport system permease protein